MTNGEHPLSSYVSQGGAINRILEMECTEDIFEDPQYTVELLRKNYGHAGKHFVKIVKELGEDAIKEMQSELQRKIHRDDTTQKQSISLSVVLTADRIATEYIFCDEEYIDAEKAADMLATQEEVSEYERCYRYLIDKINMNKQRFDAMSNMEQWGVVQDGYAIMYPQAVKELCAHGNFSYKAFLNWADRQGLLQTDGKNPTKVRKFDKKPVRCVWLKLNEFEDEDGFESAELYEQEELPFK